METEMASANAASAKRGGATIKVVSKQTEEEAFFHEITRAKSEGRDVAARVAEVWKKIGEAGFPTQAWKWGLNLLRKDPAAMQSTVNGLITFLQNRGAISRDMQPIPWTQGSLDGIEPAA
jgi:uncharacterized protein (UPF0335 family)